MITREQSRTAIRRLPAAQRKYMRALDRFMVTSTFNHQETYYDFKVNKCSVEVTTFFRLKGDPTKYRFDYEINLLERLPSVHFIRNLLWDSLSDYREGNLGPVGDAANTIV